MAGTQGMRTRLIVASSLVVSLAMFALWLVPPRSGAIAPPASLDPMGPRESSAPEPAVPAGTSAREAASVEAAGAPDETQEGTLAESAQGEVAVLVVDTYRDPIPSASVQVISGGPVGSHAADARGRCVLPMQVRKGPIELRASAPGFTSEGMRTGISPEITLELAPALSVAGRVVDHGGSPIGGAEVSFTYNGATSAPVSSDASGRFELAGVPLALEAAWVVSAPGFATLAERRTFAEAPRSLEFRLARGLPVSFEVVDGSTALPVSGARIVQHGVSARTDAAGLATCGTLVRKDGGEAKVEIEADGYVSVEGKVTPQDAERDAPIRVPLVRCATLRGRVLAEGRPLQGAKVVLEDRSYQRSAAALGPPRGWSFAPTRGASPETRSGELGEFEFQGLRPGSESYRIGVEADGRRPHAQPAGTIGAPGSESFVEVALPAPQPSGRVRGSALIGGVPTSGFVMWRGPTRTGSNVIGMGGTFVLDDVECGTVVLTLAPTSFECIRLLEGKEWSVEVRDGDESSVPISVELPVLPVRGRVLDAAGRGLAEATVTAWSREACLRDEQGTDGEGRFELHVDANAAGYTVTVELGCDREVLEGVSPGAELEIVLRGTAQVDVLAVDAATGEAVSEFLLRVDGDGPDWWGFGAMPPFRERHLRPRRGGGYVLELPMGRYQVWLESPPMRGTYLPTRAVDVDLRPGAAPLSFELRRGRECTIVLAEGEKPWSESDCDAVVLLESRWYDAVQLGPKGWVQGEGIRPWGNLRNRMVRFDASGRATIRMLDDGPYRFRAFPPTIRLEPEELRELPPDGEPIVLRWTKLGTSER